MCTVCVCIVYGLATLYMVCLSVLLFVLLLSMVFLGVRFVVYVFVWLVSVAYGFCVFLWSA